MDVTTSNAVARIVYDANYQVILSNDTITHTHLHPSAIVDKGPGAAEVEISNTKISGEKCGFVVWLFFNLKVAFHLAFVFAELLWWLEIQKRIILKVVNPSVRQV